MEEIQDFLEQYALAEYEEKEPNIFQIARFPHYENVSSNVLEYFLKYPTVLQSLLSCISNKYDASKYITIYREAQTKNNKKIDILINTDRYIIGIENKINAPLYNPVNDYCEYLQELAANEHKEMVFIVLSKNKVPKCEKYVNILYSDFAFALRKNYAKLLSSLGHRYFFLLNEYVENIESFNGGLYMNDEFVKIARIDNNSDKISQIVIEAGKLRKEFRNTADRILADLKDDNKSFKKTWCWDAFEEGNYLCYIAVFQDYYLDGDEQHNVTIDINVSASGYSVEIFERNGQFDNVFKDGLKNIIPDLSEKYRVLGIRYRYNTEYDFQEYDQLIMTLKGVLKNFADYDERKKPST
ncbi:PD-(D/E)XK nuclease family protein [Treponema endosymbiont of Eucomonympha sp.]|uniref:PD-(D/E)XK nuclease family protein n=1 Tax=Treponema endosymbiont of Eucomonympha sp. TaxID=1580831 RepID=UPI00078652AA|nr:PD-(D/E)XK nuclease family protein [Treponema endosymbiont of Eucomonympha sp.]